MDLKHLTPRIKLTIANPDTKSNSEFGPGIAALCEGIRETGSLNAAAKGLGMAYSKAWRIVGETENALGVLLIERNGANGSTLTKQGEQLLNLYWNLRDELALEATKKYKSLL